MPREPHFACDGRFPSLARQARLRSGSDRSGPRRQPRAREIRATQVRGSEGRHYRGRTKGGLWRSQLPHRPEAAEACVRGRRALASRPRGQSGLARIQLAPAPPSAGNQGSDPIGRDGLTTGGAAGLATGEEEGKRRRAARPCFCLTAGIPGGNLGGFWIRRRAAVTARVPPRRQWRSGAGCPDSDRRGLIGGDCEHGMRGHRSRRWTRPCLGTGRGIGELLGAVEIRPLRSRRRRHGGLLLTWRCTTLAEGAGERVFAHRRLEHPVGRGRVAWSPP